MKEQVDPTYKVTVNLPEEEYQMLLNQAKQHYSDNKTETIKQALRQAETTKGKRK